MTDKQKPVFARKVFASGELIFKEGDAGNEAYIVQAGTVEISKEIEGNLLVLGTIGVNTLFGEMALIDNGKRMATATARELTTCFIINKHMFGDRLAHADRFLQAVVRTLVQNVRSLSDKVASIEKQLEQATIQPPVAAE